MRFAIEIGEAEKNLLEFAFNQLLGSTVVRVNEQEVVKRTRLFSEPVHEEVKLRIGINEKWEVRIEKERKPLFGGRFSVFVNERLVKVMQGV